MLCFCFVYFEVHVNDSAVKNKEWFTRACVDTLTGHVGGFMVLLTKEPKATSQIKACLVQHDLLLERLSFHSVGIDREGLRVELE